MNTPYDEIINGDPVHRRPPGERHELICDRLHRSIHAGVANLTSTRLLERRSLVRISPASAVRPDLALITTATGKLWLAAEIVSAEDHGTDTVVKKQTYEEARLPRLWMIDPRYDNVEIYHRGEYGLVLKEILAGNEILSERLLPEFEIAVSELFAPALA
jgi:Uma2 family endonuclease